MEGLEGLEPSTRGLRGRCSNQLSYRPVVHPVGFEPTTFWSEARRSNPLSYGCKFSDVAKRSIKTEV